jgi:hypothetical protein
MSEPSYRPYIWTGPNGLQLLIQIFVEIHDSRNVDLIVRLAGREDRWSSWGPPIEFEPAP